MSRHLAPQLDLPGQEQAFNLAGELLKQAPPIPQPDTKPDLTMNLFENCPQCHQPGVFIRKRYFEHGHSDVWMCQMKGCPHFKLYWHKDFCPINPATRKEKSE